MDQLSLSLGNKRRIDHQERVRIGSADLIVSEVFDTYWKFAAERQNIFFRRLRNEFPLTADSILSSFKFTNAYRASDRVSQYLIREIVFSGEQSNNELFFRIVLFKMFNKIETWELLRGGSIKNSTKNSTFTNEVRATGLGTALSREFALQRGQLSVQISDAEQALSSAAKAPVSLQKSRCRSIGRSLE